MPPRRRAAGAVAEPLVQDPESPDADETPQQPELPVQSKLLPTQQVELEVAFVPIEQIRITWTGAPPDPGLVQSIKDIGLLNPIQVEKVSAESGEYYYVKKGRHRLISAIHAGLELVPVVVSDQDVGASLVRLVLEGRQVPNVAARFRAVEDLLSKLDTREMAAYREVSRVTGLSTGEIQECISLRVLIEPLMLGLEDGRIAGRVAIRAAAQPVQIQRLLADVLERNGKLTMKDIRAAQAQDASQDELTDSTGEAAFKFTKWRPVVEEAFEILAEKVKAADTEASYDQPVEDLIAAVHEICRNLRSLLDTAPSSSGDE